MRHVIFAALFSALITTAQAQVSPSEKTRFEECRAKLIAAQKLDILQDFGWKPPREPKVVAGPTFINMPFNAKENFVATVNCFLMAGKGGSVDFDVLHWQTGKPLGRFSLGSFNMN